MTSFKGFTREELAALSPWRLPIMDEEEPVIVEEPPPPEEEAEEMIPPPMMPTAEEIEAMQKQAYDEAAASGYQDGFERGHSEGRETGWREGHEAGLRQGLEEGRQQGQQDGHREGFQQGFEEGRCQGLAEGREVMLKEAARFEPLMDCLADPLAQLDDEIEQELVTLAIAIAKQLIRRELKTDPGQIIAVVRDVLAILPSSSRRVNLHLHPDDAELIRSALALREGGPRWKIIEDPLLTRGGCEVSTETSHIDATLEKRLMAVIAHVLGGGREGDTP